jgi:hypothetical protein
MVKMWESWEQEKKKRGGEMEWVEVVRFLGHWWSRGRLEIWIGSGTEGHGGRRERGNEGVSGGPWRLLLYCMGVWESGRKENGPEKVAAGDEKRGFPYSSVCCVHCVVGCRWMFVRSST